jgi:hypothetical protein
MRYAAYALMACLAGCSLTPGGTGGECVSDSQCGDDICARGGECTGRTSVRDVMVRWTVNGVAAGTTACNSHPDLFLQFDGPDYGDTIRFAPVPCVAGLFNIDKLPKRYAQVELGIDGATGSVVRIDARTAQAQFDLLQ